MASNQSRQISVPKPSSARTNVWGRVGKVITIHQARQGIIQNHGLIAGVLFLGVVGLMGCSPYLGGREVANPIDHSTHISDQSTTSVFEQFLVNHPQAGTLDGSKSKMKNQQLLRETKAAVEEDSNNPVVQTNYGEVLRRVGDLHGAAEAHAKALRLAPGLTEARLGQALVEQDRGNGAAALSVLEQVAEEEKSAVASFYWGVFLLNLEDLEGAEKAFRKAVVLDKNWAFAHVALGFVLDEEKRYEDAVASYRTAIRLDPNDATAHVSLGLALNSQGKSKKAVASYKTAIRLDPNYAKAHNNLGHVLNRQGKYEEAIASLKTAIRLQPNYTVAHQHLGNVLTNQGKYEEAIASLQTAIRLDPNHAMAHNNLGGALQSQGKHEEAIASYKTAIRLDPNHSLAHNNLGFALILQEKSDRAQAIKEMREARRLFAKQGDNESAQSIDELLTLLQTDEGVRELRMSAARLTVTQTAQP